MARRLPPRGVRVNALIVLAVLAGASVPLLAAKKKPAVPEAQPVRSTLQPSYSIAAGPLGFSAPGEFYMGARNSLMSLDFLDEDHLLFTFRVPGLIHRAGNRQDSEGERKIRALVLRLPSGAIEAEAVWTLHDRARYVYGVGNGQFLLRDRDTLSIGDASLQLKAYLRFPGPVLWLELDPSGKFLLTGSSEPSPKPSKEGDAGSSSSAQTAGDQPGEPEKSDTILRVFRREDSKVMLASHVRSAVHLPINAEGYLETLRARGQGWTLNFAHFSGGTTPVGSFESACSPMINFISESEFLLSGCSSSGDPKVQAMGMNGRRLWDLPAAVAAVWPLLVTNSPGTRLARETLLADRAVTAIAPLEVGDIKGQDVQVLDAATGKMVLRAAASPILDAGGNVAISPSGRRVVILMGGNLQVFDLPAPPPLPDTGLTQAGR